MHKSFDLFKSNYYDLDRIERIKEEHRTIFLDIHGVLQRDQIRHDHDNNLLKKYLYEKYNDERYLRMKPEDIGAVFYDWRPIAIGYLKELLYVTGSNIVISSDWKDNHPFEFLKGYFKVYDMEDYVVDTTKPGLDKKEAIKLYLSEHPEIKKHIIYDDCNWYEDFGPNFKRVCNNYGIFHEEEYRYGYLLLNGNPKTEDDGECIRFADDLTLEKHEFVIDGLRLLYLKPIYVRDINENNNFRFGFTMLDTYMKNKDKYDYLILDNKNIHLSNFNFASLDYNDLFTFPAPWWSDEHIQDVKKCLLSRIKR